MAMTAGIFKGPSGFGEIYTYDAPDKLRDFIDDWLKRNRIRVGQAAVEATQGLVAGRRRLVPAIPGDMQGLAVALSLAGDLNAAGFETVYLIDETPGLPLDEMLIATVATPAPEAPNLAELGAGRLTTDWDGQGDSW